MTDIIEYGNSTLSLFGDNDEIDQPLWGYLRIVSDRQAKRNRELGLQEGDLQLYFGPDEIEYVKGSEGVLILPVPHKGRYIHVKARTMWPTDDQGKFDPSLSTQPVCKSAGGKAFSSYVGASHVDFRTGMEHVIEGDCDTCPFSQYRVQKSVNGEPAFDEDGEPIYIEGDAPCRSTPMVLAMLPEYPNHDTGEPSLVLVQGSGIAGQFLSGMGRIKELRTESLKSTMVSRSSRGSKSKLIGAEGERYGIRLTTQGFVTSNNQDSIRYAFELEEIGEDLFNQWMAFSSNTIEHGGSTGIAEIMHGQSDYYAQELGQRPDNGDSVPTPAPTPPSTVTPDQLRERMLDDDFEDLED